jgi:transcriptional regulator with XRE-family HTH domain
MNKVVQMRSPKTNEQSGTELAPREYHRTPWSGNLDEAELNRPGGLLLAALIRCANERRQQLNDMSRELGVTYGYLNQLRNGFRQTSQISDDFAHACARYLNVPRLTVLMLAGRITPEDAFESDQTVASEIPRAVAYICEDPDWGALVPPEVRAGTYRAQFLIVRLYEEATGKRLLPERLNIRTLAGEIQKLLNLQEKRREAVDAYVAKKRSDSPDAPVLD